MKKHVSMFVFVLLILCYPAFSDDYFPINEGDTWTYSTYLKDNPSKKFNINVRVCPAKKISGKFYYLFQAQDADVSYSFRKDDTGVYAKIMSYPYMGFTIDVYLEPELQTIRFPLKVGDKWEYSGQAYAYILGIFKITRNIKAEFEVVESRTIDTPAGAVESFCVVCTTDEGNSSGAKASKYWYGKDIGNIINDTPKYYAGIQSYNKKK